MNKKNVVIFGGTSTIALACARIWVAQGFSIFSVGRDRNKLDGALADLRARATHGQRIAGLSADLNDLERHERLFVDADRSLGGIDIVLIAHGTLPDQKACEQSVQIALAEIQTNALSAISLLTLAGNYLERQRHGSIVTISSVAGDRGRRSNYVYGASKGAISLFMQGLRSRLVDRNVDVICIKPGFVDTPMTAAFQKNGLLWAQPDVVAQGIVAAVAKRRDVVYLPWFWRWIMLVIKIIPERIFKRLSL